jgi:hypothetical protein
MRPQRQALPSGVDLSSESHIVSDAPASSCTVACEPISVPIVGLVHSAVVTASDEK